MKAFSQIIFIQNRIAYYQGSLSTPLFEIITTLIKGIKQMVYKIILLFAEVYTFWVVNKAFSKHCRAKKARVRKRGIFIVEDI